MLLIDCRVYLIWWFEENMILRHTRFWDLTEDFSNKKKNPTWLSFFSLGLLRFVLLSRIQSWWCPRVPIRSWRALLDSGWSGPLLSWFAASAALCSVNWSDGVRRGWGSSVWGPWRWSLWSVQGLDTLWENHLSSVHHLKWCLHSYLSLIWFLKGTGHHHQVGSYLFMFFMLTFKKKKKTQTCSYGNQNSKFCCPYRSTPTGCIPGWI